MICPQASVAAAIANGLGTDWSLPQIIERCRAALLTGEFASMSAKPSRFAAAHALLAEIERLTPQAKTPDNWRRITALQLAYEAEIRNAVMTYPIGREAFT
jgi:hypothetical protein